VYDWDSWRQKLVNQFLTRRCSLKELQAIIRDNHCVRELTEEATRQLLATGKANRDDLRLILMSDHFHDKNDYGEQYRERGLRYRQLRVQAAEQLLNMQPTTKDLVNLLGMNEVAEQAGRQLLAANQLSDEWVSAVFDRCPALRPDLIKVILNLRQATASQLHEVVVHSASPQRSRAFAKLRTIASSLKLYDLLILLRIDGCRHEAWELITHRGLNDTEIIQFVGFPDLQDDERELCVKEIIDRKLTARDLIGLLSDVCTRPRLTEAGYRAIKMQLQSQKLTNEELRTMIRWVGDDTNDALGRWAADKLLKRKLTPEDVRAFDFLTDYHDQLFEKIKANYKLTLAALRFR